MQRPRLLRRWLVPSSVLVTVSLLIWVFAFAAPSTGASPQRGVHHVLRSASFQRIQEAVGGGKVDAAVARELRKTGHADAIVIFAYQDTLAAAEAAAPASGSARTRAIVTSTHAAYAATKTRVLGRLSGATLLRDFDVLPLAYVRFSSKAALLAVANDPEVLAVQKNGTVEPTLAQSLPLIGQPTAAANGFTGQNTAVAVLDTGVNYTLSAFGSCTAPGVPAGCKVVVAQDFAVNDGSLDDNGHGTNVAGIVVGVAPSTKILALDVFGPGGTGSDTDIIAAINFTVSNQATYNVRAMNLSLGDGSHHTSTCAGSTYDAAFANARAVKIMPVVAAGNDAVMGGVFVNGISSPACVPGAMSVGAVYDGNNGGLIWGTPPNTCTDVTSAADQITCFSQSASFLTVLAPGAMITAAGITEGGTSQATPHVAGAAAVLAAANPTATLDQISAAIANSGPTITDSRNGVAKHRFYLPDAITAVGTSTTTTSTTTTSTTTTSTTTTSTTTTPPPATHPRTVSFFSAGRKAKGQVGVTDGFAACAANVPIRLQYRAAGKWRTADTGATNATGGFRASLSPGLYRIIATAVTLTSGDVCSKAISNRLFW